MTYEPITDQEIKTNIAYFSDLRDKLVSGKPWIVFAVA